MVTDAGKTIRILTVVAVVAIVSAMVSTGLAVWLLVTRPAETVTASRCDVLTELSSTVTSIQQSGVEQRDQIAVLAARLASATTAGEGTQFDLGVQTAAELYKQNPQPESLAILGDAIALDQQRSQCT